MRPAVVLALVGLSGVALADDYLWFERDWISDSGATFRENPDYERLPDNVREKFRAQFGKMRWRVSDGMLEVIPPDSPPFSRPYFIRPIDENSFELIMSDGEIETVRRIGDGFCLETELPVSADAHKPFVLECLAPHDV
jgi:hypothetical protein